MTALATATKAAKAISYCTMFADNLALGVDIGLVQEIIPYQEMTPVPLAPEAIAGLINLRGQIVAVIDLRTRLGLPPRPADLRPLNVVVRIDDRAVSLLVDRIGDVVTTAEGPDEVPETLHGVARDLVVGVHQLNEELLLVLDAVAATIVEAGGPGEGGTTPGEGKTR